jgi:hypothetical protein
MLLLSPSLNAISRSTMAPSGMRAVVGVFLMKVAASPLMEKPEMEMVPRMVLMM